jgi:hypothetical protein
MFTACSSTFTDSVIASSFLVSISNQSIMSCIDLVMWEITECVRFLFLEIWKDGDRLIS